MKVEPYKLGRYFLTAGVAAIVDILTYTVLRSLGGLIEFSAVISFLMASVVNYRLSAKYVFSSSVSASGYARFIAGALVGFGINIGVTAFCERFLEFYPMFSKLFGVGLAFIVNFYINSKVVFLKKDP